MTRIIRPLYSQAGYQRFYFLTPVVTAMPEWQTIGLDADLSSLVSAR